MKRLIPAIIQEDKTGEILMLGYMDKEAMQQTKETGLVHFWSRSRKKIWKKGETSGNFVRVKKILADCDNDTLLIKVKLLGERVCHTGERSCFHRSIYESR